ncbi:Ig-like domain-containing protein [Nocardioides sp. YIM 152588]|uniref:Ig-like domain-containing protein n=1 Tax=Nocardioides sp. YIM 152588 TaxID=3158259 RepID=UPI0032E4F06A
MTSSGIIKRGLATSAVAALAITGLATGASANSVTAQQGGDDVVTLFSQSTGETSIRNDGVDTKVRLAAGAGANVTSVTFQYNVADEWVTIAEATRNAAGLFVYDWDVPGSILGASGAVRAVSTPDVAESADSGTEVDFNAAGAPIDSVALTPGAGPFMALGAYANPTSGEEYVTVSGTASSDDDVDVYVINGDEQFLDNDASDDYSEGDTGFDTLTVDGGAFRDVLEITGYEWDEPSTNEDQLVLGAANDSDTVEAYTLYRQEVASVTATADVDTVIAGETTDVTVTVTDQYGKPIYGADVALAGSIEGTTDIDGMLVIEDVPAGTHTFYVNADADAAFDAEAGDVAAADLTIADYTPEVTTLVAESVEGAAFDIDEFDEGDIAVSFEDQNGDPISVTGDLEYYWVWTPFDGDAVRTPETDVATESLVDADSVALLPAGDGPGTYELFAGLSGDTPVASSQLLSVVIGEAEIALEQESYVAASGGTVTVAGTVLLEDGTPLADRALTVDYYAGDDADVAATEVTTDADGKFSVDVVDPSTDGEAEVDGEIDVYSEHLMAGDSASVEFTSDILPTGSEIEFDSSGSAYNPGEAKWNGFYLLDNEGEPLPGRVLHLTVDSGFFTDGDSAEPAAGAYTSGVLNDLGTEMTVITDGDGYVDFATSIGRDEGFDDDAMHTATVTATIGDLSVTDDIEWDTYGAENVSEISVERVAGQGPAAPGDAVAYDVFAKDQFGNPVVGVPVQVIKNEITTDLIPGGYITVTGSEIESDLDTTGEFTVASERAGEYLFDVVHTGDDAEMYVVDGESLDTEYVSADTEFVEEWYVAEATDFELAAPESVDIEDVAIVTATVVDQKGAVLEGAEVVFARQGAANFTATTDANGVASYAFTSDEAGVQKVTAILGTMTKSVSITFTKESDPLKARIALANKAKKDQLTVKASEGGVKVRFFKKTKSGQEFLGSDFADASGVAQLKVKDANGKKFTKYFAKVSSLTEKVTTATKRIR